MNFKIECLAAASQFINLASNLLYEREAEYSLLLGLCELQASAEKPSADYKYFCLFRSEKLVGAAVLNERRLVVTDFPESCVQFLVRYLVENQILIPGVVGPINIVEKFAKHWSSAIEQKMMLTMGQSIYQLSQVAPSKNVLGKLVAAKEQELNVISKWLHEFSLEATPHQPTNLEKMTALAKTKISKHEAYLWLDQDEHAVSMTLVGRPTKNGISISGVFTPKQLRGNGYASAVVASTSQVMLDKGKKFCVLYTDTANPTSNKIYKKIGFQEVASSRDFVFN